MDNMFIAAQVIIAPHLETIQVPTTIERIKKKLWFVHKTKNPTAMKIN